MHIRLHRFRLSYIASLHTTPSLPAGRIANASDILLFYRRNRSAGDRARGGAGGADASSGINPLLRMRPINMHELHAIKVEDLVLDQLATQRNEGRGLKVVEQDKFSEAVEKYVSGECALVHWFWGVSWIQR